MCHNTPPPSDLTHTNSILKTGDRVSGLTTPTPPRRKNRTKTRKPKFLSLRLQLSPKYHKPSSPSLSNEMTRQQQLNLFPLHPENLVDEKDMMMQDDQNVAFLFTSHAPATLNGLLEQDSTTTTTTTTEEEEECLMRWPLDEENGSSLVRKAMKRRSKEEERDGREERWVCYSEVTSYSSATTTESTATTTTTTFGLLSLKLDYEGVLNAWSDQRSLYVPGETPPHHVLPHHPPHVGCVGNNSSSSSVDGKGKGWEEEGEGEGEERGRKRGERKMGEREASVLRYKQKRQSRLFSKRIRYEVRKLNAEKRPRMKGRFVKRD